MDHLESKYQIHGGTKSMNARFGGKKMIKLALGIVLGAIAGFAYYKFIGCATGACPITSNPYVSSIYGALVGLLIAMN